MYEDFALYDQGQHLIFIKLKYLIQNYLNKMLKFE